MIYDSANRIEDKQTKESFKRWKKVADALDMQVYGWTFDYSAQFVDKKGKVHTLTIEMREAIERLIK